MNSTTTPEIVKEEKVEKGVKLELPRMEDAVSHYDKEKNMFWVAIPVDKVDAFMAACILDSMKLNYCGAFRDMVARTREKKAAIIPASAFTKMRENFVKKLHK